MASRGLRRRPIKFFIILFFFFFFFFFFFYFFVRVCLARSCTSLNNPADVLDISRRTQQFRIAGIILPDKFLLSSNARAPYPAAKALASVLLQGDRASVWGTLLSSALTKSGANLCSSGRYKSNSKTAGLISVTI